MLQGQINMRRVARGWVRRQPSGGPRRDRPRRRPSSRLCARRKRWNVQRDEIALQKSLVHFWKLCGQLLPKPCPSVRFFSGPLSSRCSSARSSSSPRSPPSRPSLPPLVTSPPSILSHVRSRRCPWIAWDLKKAQSLGLPYPWGVGREHGGRNLGTYSRWDPSGGSVRVYMCKSFWHCGWRAPPDKDPASVQTCVPMRLLVVADFGLPWDRGKGSEGGVGVSVSVVHACLPCCYERRVRVGHSADWSPNLCWTHMSSRHPLLPVACHAYRMQPKSSTSLRDILSKKTLVACVPSRIVPNTAYLYFTSRSCQHQAFCTPLLPRGSSQLVRVEVVDPTALLSVRALTLVGWLRSTGAGALAARGLAPRRRARSLGRACHHQVGGGHEGGHGTAPPRRSLRPRADTVHVCRGLTRICSDGRCPGTV